VDDRALEAIYRTRYASFRNALATITGSWDTAHDAVQEAFARALAERGFRGGSIEAWLWTVALRVATGARTREQAFAAAVELEPALVEPERDPELAERCSGCRRGGS